MKLQKFWYSSTSEEVAAVANDINIVSAFVTDLFTLGCVVSILSVSELDGIISG
jgi:hypothetical protein